MIDESQVVDSLELSKTSNCQANIANYYEWLHGNEDEEKEETEQIGIKDA